MSLNNNELNTKVQSIRTEFDALLDLESDKDHFFLTAIESLLKLKGVNPDPADFKLIQVALGELIESCLLFRSYRDVRKVAIFGSARTKPDHPNYKIAEDTAKRLVESGMMVITGAGPGIMEAGNKGLVLVVLV